MKGETVNLAPLEVILGVRFRDKTLLVNALTHRSYLNENRTFPLPHNERLEFLGDAVLEMAITEHLYLEYPNQEGELTNLRSAVANYKFLAEVCRGLRIEDFMLMSKGEWKDAGRAREVILANAIEAVIGAMYLDAGFRVCKEFISKKILVALPKLIAAQKIFDAKSQLQESVQAKCKITPTYKVLKESGPDHNRMFFTAAMIGEIAVGSGQGFSKQESEIAAAANALTSCIWEKW